MCWERNGAFEFTLISARFSFSPEPSSSFSPASRRPPRPAWPRPSLRRPSWRRLSAWSSCGAKTSSKAPSRHAWPTTPGPLPESRVGPQPLGKRSVGFAVVQVQPVTALEQLNLLFCHGRLVEDLERLLRSSEPAAGRLGLGQQLQGLLHRHVDRRHARRQAACLFARFDIGAKRPL